MFSFKVVGAKVVTNARSPGARCYGFVTMSTAEEATKCINHLHKTELHGKMISVEKVRGHFLPGIKSKGPFSSCDVTMLQNQLILPTDSFSPDSLSQVINEPAGKKTSERREGERKKEKSSSADRYESSRGDYGQDDLSLDVLFLTFPWVGKAVRLLPPCLLCTCWRIFPPVLRGVSSSSPRLHVLRPVVASEAAPSSLSAHCRSLGWVVPSVFHLTHICICMPFTDLPTSRGKRRLTEKMTLKRVKTGVERRVKTRMIRNLALQSALEPQSQVADQWV